MKKRRAFTLSELLVVVVIIGVLSAVVLPKFSKVIETRKTTEAEELMSAVRTEQEARCTLSKKYTDQTAGLGSYKDGKNFDYTLGTVGMSASAKSGKYTLEMPSYADGRICCSSGCDSLNKNYPLCSELTDTSKTPDYVAGNEDCGVEPCVGADCYPTCPENHEEVSPYTDAEGCTVTTSWILKEYPTCWVSSTSKSNCPAKECSNKDEHTAGTTTTTDNEECTVNTTWIFTDYPTCQWNKTETKDCPSNECDQDAKPVTEKDCGCGYNQTRSVTCDTSTNYQWKIQVGSSTDADGWGACNKPSSDSTVREDCPPGQIGAGIYKKWSDETCDYEVIHNGCQEDNRPLLKPDGYVTLQGSYRFQDYSCGPIGTRISCSSHYYSQDQLLAVEEPVVGGSPNGYYGVYKEKPSGCSAGHKCNCEIGQKYIDKSTARNFKHDEYVVDNYGLNNGCPRWYSCSSSVEVMSYSCTK